MIIEAHRRARVGFEGGLLVRRYGNYLMYLVFPLVGVLLALAVPEEKLPLRILVVLVVTALGVSAADAGVSVGSLRSVSESIGSYGERLRVRRRPRAAIAMITLATIFMLLSAVQFSPIENLNHNFAYPVLLVLCGLAAAWMSFSYSAPPVEVATVTSAPLTPSRGKISWTILGILLLFAAGEAGGNSLGADIFQQLPLAAQAAMFYGGVVAVVLGLGGVRLPDEPQLAGLRKVRLRLPRLNDPRMEIVLVLLIFIGALVIRTWNLESGLRLSVDEAVALDNIGHYYGGRVALVSPPSQYITTLLFPQWQALVISLLGTTVTTLRLTSAVVGALTVVATYFLARDLFNNRFMGAVAALFLMTFPPHIQFSRIMLPHVVDPLFGTLAIWSLVRGIRWNRRVDWALGGAFLGLTQYFFEAGRLFYIPLVLVWFGSALALFILTVLLIPFRRVPLLRNLVRGVGDIPRLPMQGIVVAVLVCLMVAMPTYYAAFSQGGDVNPRLTDSGGLNIVADALKDGLTPDETSVLAQRFLFPFTVYVHQPEIAFFYGGDQPMMLVYAVTFFFLGMAYLLWRWRSVPFILVLWIVSTGISNALLRDSAVYARWHVVFPAVAVVVAVGVRYLLPAIWSREVTPEGEDAAPISVYRRAWGVLVALVLVFMMAGQVVYYYGYHVPLLEKEARLSKPYPDVFDAAIRASKLPSQTDIYLIGDPIPDINVPRTWIDFLTKADRSTMDYYPLSAEAFTQEFVNHLPKDHNLALFVDPAAKDAIARMQADYSCTMQHSPYPIDPPEKEFLLCYVPNSSGG